MNDNRFGEKRKTILAIFLVLLVGITIGYAYLNANLNINGSSNIKGNKWDVHFENIEISDGSIKTPTPATIDSTKQNIDYTVVLNKPGDYYEFTTSIVNDGTIDGKLGDNTNLITPELTDEQKKYLTYTVTYENGNQINKGDLLRAEDSKNILVRVEYKKTLKNEDLPQVDKTLNIKFHMEYVQDDGTGKDIDANTSKSLKTLKKLQKLNSSIKLNSTTPDFSKTATTAEGLFSLLDDYGDSYYFRGSVTNNYVKLGKFYWRIVRINGDGSIRLIYDGTSAHSNGSSTDKQIGTSIYNSNYNDNAYVGYMYGSPGATNYDEAHGYINNSTIKTYLDNWYTTNLSSYAQQISDTEFCNDRSIKESPESNWPNTGYGTSQTRYAARTRLYASKTPALTCVNKDDRFTVSNTKIGNGALTYPIGLLTADEASIAGAVNGKNNTSYYLYSGSWYWLATPFNFIGGFASEYIFNNNGNLVSNYVNHTTGGVRPIINIKPDSITSGTGDMNTPFIVE